MAARTLHQVVRKGDEYWVKRLLAKGENVDQKDKEGNTPLFTAVEKNNINVATILLEAGADVNIANVFGETPSDFVGSNAMDELLKSYMYSDIKEPDPYGSDY